jgi:hypothetical protein
MAQAFRRRRESANAARRGRCPAAIRPVSFGNVAGNVVIADDGTWANDVGSLTAHGAAGNDYIFKDDAKVIFG